MNLNRAFRLILATLALVLGCEQPTETTTPQPAAARDPVFVVHLQNGSSPTAAYSGCSDTTLFNGPASDYEYGGSTVLTVGTATTSATIRRSLVKFELSNVVIPSSATVERAYLTLHTYGGGGLTSDSKIYAYRLTTSWREGDSAGEPSTSYASWDDPGPGTWSTAGGDFDVDPMSEEIPDSNSSGFITFELDASVVDAWVEDRTTNHGLVLKHGTEESVLDYVSFISSEWPEPAERPILTVYYSVD